jgi:hypothetical protein
VGDVVVGGEPSADPGRAGPTRRRVALIALGTVLAVTAGVGLVAIREHDEEPSATRAGPSTSLGAPAPTVTALPAPTTTEAKSVLAADVPPETVVSTRDQPQRVGDRTVYREHILAVDTATGSTTRVLSDLAESRFESGVAVSPDGSTVYFAETGPGGATTALDDACTPRLFRVPMAGGDIEQIADGVSPAPSPNGRYLAYVANGFARGNFDGRATYCGLFAVVVRDLVTGAEKVSIPTRDDVGWLSMVGAGSIAWTPDSRRLAYSAGFEGGTVFTFDLESGSTRELQTTDAIDTVALRRFGDRGRELGLTLGNPRWTSAGELAVTLSCYGCTQGYLEGVAADGNVVDILTAVDLTDLGRAGAFTLRATGAAAGSRGDVFVETNGVKTVLATDSVQAAWPAPTRIIPPLDGRYPVQTPAIPAGHRLELRDRTLVEVDGATGTATDVFRALGPLDELAVGAGPNAYVVEHPPHDLCVSRIWEIPMHGGLATPRVDGTKLLLSPDGSLLASTSGNSVCDTARYGPVGPQMLETDGEGNLSGSYVGVYDRSHQTTLTMAWSPDSQLLSVNLQVPASSCISGVGVRTLSSRSPSANHRRAVRTR